MNRKTNYIKLNGKLASEFLIHAYIAASPGSSLRIFKR